MIARTWRGATAEHDADAYVDYLMRTGVKGCHETDGNRGVLLLRRTSGGRAEFLFISLWESLDAVRAFAGDDIEKAVFYPEDDRFLVDREWTASHYEVVVSP